MRTVINRRFFGSTERAIGNRKITESSIGFAAPFHGIAIGRNNTIGDNDIFTTARCIGCFETDCIVIGIEMAVNDTHLTAIVDIYTVIVIITVIVHIYTVDENILAIEIMLRPRRRIA